MADPGARRADPGARRAAVLRWGGEVLVAVVVGWLAALAANAELTTALQARPAQPVPPVGGGYALALGAAAVLVLRTRRPIVVAIAVALITFAYRAVGYPGEAPGMALFVSSYALGAHLREMPASRHEERWPGRRSLVVVGVLTAAAVLVPVLPPHPAALDWAVLGPGIGLVTAALLGVSVRQRRVEEAERVRRAAAVAEATTARRLADQRVGIARELHDVLAHTISVITVQSRVALDVLDDEPERARPALEAIRSASREAVGELRAAVRSLRADDAVPGDSLTPPTLAGLDGLADAARAAGLAVRIRHDWIRHDWIRPDWIRPDEADRDPDGVLPPLVQAAAYRIVQEALTNCVRHSPGHAVDVRLGRRDGALTVEVLDDGRPTEPAPAPDDAGHGLLGIRERAAALGGRAEAGWSASGGFRVYAELPLDGPAGARSA